MGNQLGQDRSNAEKLEMISAARSAARKASAKAVALTFLVLLLCLPLGAMALYSFFTFEAFSLFKLAFWLLLPAIVIALIISVKHFSNDNGGFHKTVCTLLTVASILIAFFMLTSGRLGIDNVITADGFTYVQKDGEYKIHSYEGTATELVLSALPEEITGIEQDAFKGNKTLQTLVADVATLVIGKGAFADCTSLTTVRFAEGDFILADDVFQGCTRLTGVTFNGGDYTFSGSDIFDGCTRLTDIYMHEGSYKTDALFYNLLSGLGKIAVHHDNADIDVSLGGANELTLVVYPNTTTMYKIEPDVLVFKDGYDFNGWSKGNTSSITPFAPKIYLPASITEVPDGIFGSNSSASDVYYQGSADMWSYVSIPGLDGWIFGSNSNYSRDFTRMHYNSTCRHWGTSSQGTEN